MPMVNTRRNLTSHTSEVTAKWYMSKKFQTAKPLIWEEYIRYIRVALTGEKRNICVTIEEILA